MRDSSERNGPAAFRIPSLRSNFAWTFAGNSIYAAGQWAILSLFAKLGGSEMLGDYALAVAVTAPVVMLSHLNLRAVLATDVSRRHPFGDYLVVRNWASGAALLAIAGLAAFAGGNFERMIAILALGAGQSAETVSDTYLGAMQRREQMHLVARSMILRTAISLAALAVTLWLTRDLIASVLALAAGRLVVLLAFDRRIGVQGEDLSRTGAAAYRGIFRSALPLGMVLMLISLNTNLPRYVVEYFLGAAPLGVFAAVISFITVGSTVVNALGHSAMPRLAVYFREGNRSQFLRLVGKSTLLVIGLGAAGMLCAWVAGSLVLRLLYRPEFASFDSLLVGAMGAGAISYLAISLGYAVTSTRAFDVQLPLFALAAAVCGVTSWLLVPRVGLSGAVTAVAVAALVQVLGQVAILARIIRRMESSP